MKSPHTLTGSRPCPSSRSGNTHQQSQGKRAASQMAGMQSFVSKPELLAPAAVRSVTMVRYPLPPPPPPSTPAVQEEQRRSAAPTSRECSAFGGLLSRWAGINLPWDANVKEGAWHQVKIARAVPLMCLCAEQKPTIVYKKA